MKKYLMLFMVSVCLLNLLACGQNDSRRISNEEEGVSGCGEMTGVACDMFILLNDYRVANGLPLLKSTKKCIALAQDHAKDMVDRKFFDHESPTESFSQRAQRYGFRGGDLGENIARGSGSADIMFKLLTESAEHRANILRASYKSAGIGYFEEHWVQCFSSRN